MTRTDFAAVVVLGWALGAFGCAQAMRDTPGAAVPLNEALATLTDDRRQADEADQSARSAEAELTTVRLDAAPAACTRACTLQATICELAGRICAIASRHVDDAPLTRRCTDSRIRCVRARETVAARCTCSAPPRGP